MIENEINARIQDLVQRLHRLGMDVGAYLEAVGQTNGAVLNSVSPPSRRSTRPSVGRRSPGAGADDDRIDEVIAEMAGPVRTRRTQGPSPRSVRSALAPISQQAAMEWLTDNVELVDEHGEAIDRGRWNSPPGAEEDSEEGDRYGLQPPYLVPTVVEQTNRGEAGCDLYSKPSKGAIFIGADR